MIYDITKPTAPALPTLGKGTECIKLLLSQASKDIQEPLVPMFFPILGAHVCDAEFQYPDLSWKELCGIMANLVAESGGNKGQLSIQRVNKSTSQQVPPAELFISFFINFVESCHDSAKRASSFALAAPRFASLFFKRSVLNSKSPFHYVKNLIHYAKNLVTYEKSIRILHPLPLRGAHAHVAAILHFLGPPPDLCDILAEAA